MFPQNKPQTVRQMTWESDAIPPESFSQVHLLASNEENDMEDPWSSHGLP